MDIPERIPVKKVENTGEKSLPLFFVVPDGLREEDKKTEAGLHKRSNIIVESIRPCGLDVFLVQRNELLLPNRYNTFSFQKIKQNRIKKSNLNLYREKMR